MQTDKRTNATRFVLYSQDHEDQFVCVMEEWNGRRYVETDIRQRHERAIYALIDCKREAILADRWHERSGNTPPKTHRAKNHTVPALDASGARPLAEGVQA